MRKADNKQNFWQTVKPGLKKTGHILALIGKWIYRLRGFLLSVPVAVAAIYLAVRSNQTLPQMVGIDLQASGAFGTMIDRSVAVWVPLGITAACLVFTCCSRRVVYPWLIGVFSLVLPILLQLTNAFLG